MERRRRHSDESRRRRRLGLKVFLAVAAALALTSALIYALVAVALPASYENVATSRVHERLDALGAQLAETPYADAAQPIYDFCIENNATAVLVVGNDSSRFGTEPDAGSESAVALSTNVRFADQDSGYLTIVANLPAAGELPSAFWSMLPAVVTAILAAAVLVAWGVSRIINRLVADVADAKRAERQRRDFFAAVSHELKTPLCALKAQIECMLYGIGDFADRDKHLPAALKATENLEGLVGEVLFVAGLEADDLDRAQEDVSAAALVRETCDALAPLANERGIVLDVDLQGDATVRANPALMAKALANVVSNGVAYSPGGARVSVRLADGALTVENTGVELSEEELARAFEPFYRAETSRNRATGGSGLGLYIVKTVLDRYGIPFSLSSADGRVVFQARLSRGRSI
ncbi:sensor histidine kinase [Gordonibacter urolithinfaciens]|uniref:sensor histidine kinase n=1 Tax=Gordonibacter urolithinfaciens TaxID=1335613 RepID=UPI000F4D1800|nr:HAMP domain-containing sensor histidine kinase [Gordonibacter urolithinfaciens]